MRVKRISERLWWTAVAVGFACWLWAMTDGQWGWQKWAALGWVALWVGIAVRAQVGPRKKG